jgi:hypothetical protein
MPGRLRVPQEGLNPHQQSLIRKTSVTPEQIFENMDSLNDEIAETYQGKTKTTPEPVVQKKMVAAGPQRVQRIHVPEPKKEAPMLDIDEMERGLEAELAAVEAKQRQQPASKQVEAAPEEEQLSPAEQQRLAILDLLKKTPGAPSEAQIEALKAKNDNSVYVLALGEGDVYVFTHLRRGAFQKIRKLVAAGQEGQVGGDPEEMMKEKVLQYTVLWPKVGSPEFLYNSRAGVVDTLYQTVLLHSYFLTPQQSMMLTTQL